MNNPMNALVNSLLSNNPRISQNPMARELINIVQSGDAKRGEQIADNLCRTYGISRQDAIANARRFFHL